MLYLAGCGSGVSRVSAVTINRHIFRDTQRMLESGIPESATRGTVFFYATVSNSKGTATSSNAVKVIFDDGATAGPTGVFASPMSQTIAYQATATDAVTCTVSIADPAINDATLRYQWYKAISGATTVGGTELVGKTAAALTPDTSAEGTFYYYVVVTNSKGFATSNIVTVIVGVTAAPSGVTIAPGADQSVAPNAATNALTATVTNSGGAAPASLTYQWYSNTTNSTTGGTAVSGATSATFTPPSTAAGTLYYYCVVSNAIGSATSTSTPGPAVKVTVEAPFKLRYSEGWQLLDATTNTLTIDLATPQGAATTRFFTARNSTDSANYTVALAQWVLSDASITLSQVTANQAYGVVIPAGYSGTFTLTVSDTYTITFNVGGTGGTDIGETWLADGIDWRILAKGAGTLVIAEHVQLDQQINATSTNWDTNIKWAGSSLRADLNGTGAAGTRPAKTWYEARNLGSLGIVPTQIFTRIGWNDVRYGGYEALAGQSFFLLSEEEVFNALGASGTQVPDLTKNLFAPSVLFRDANARKASTLASTTSWWLRSPRSLTSSAAMVNSATGVAYGSTVSNTFGVRPAFVTNLIP